MKKILKFYKRLLFEQAFTTMVMVIQSANAELDVGVSTPQPSPLSRLERVHSLALLPQPERPEISTSAGS